MFEGSLLITLIASLAFSAWSWISYRRLGHFKGPPIAAHTSLWVAYQEINARMSVAEREALEKYGSPARIAPRLLVTDDVELLRHMSAPRSKWTRGSWYDGVRFDPRVDNVFSMRDEKEHNEMRAKLIGAYSGKEVKTLEDDMDIYTQQFMSLIKRKYEGRVMDMAVVSSYFTLDVLSKVAFGQALGFLEANEDLYSYQKSSSEFMPILQLMVNHSTIRFVIQNRFVQALMAPKGSDQVGLGPVIGIIRKVIEERFNSIGKGQDRKDMLANFISKGLTQTQVEAESHVQLTAGADSTSTSLRIAVYMIISNPHTYIRLRAEIDKFVAERRISRPVISYSQAVEIPFLTACIWETIRMYPPLFSFTSKVAPPGCEMVSGIFYPGGTEVAPCLGVVGRSKKVFGEDSHMFRPERWLHPDQKTRTSYMRVTELIFGSGRHTCLGKNLALMELHKALFELFYAFDWAIPDPIRGVDSTAHGLWIQKNVNVVARTRNH